MGGAVGDELVEAFHLALDVLAVALRHEDDSFRDTSPKASSDLLMQLNLVNWRIFLVNTI